MISLKEGGKRGQLLISPAIYEQLFCTKVFCAAFMWLCTAKVFNYFGDLKSAQNLFINVGEIDYSQTHLRKNLEGGGKDF